MKQYLQKFNIFLLLILLFGQKSLICMNNPISLTLCCDYLDMVDTTLALEFPENHTSEKYDFPIKLSNILPGVDIFINSIFSKNQKICKNNKGEILADISQKYHNDNEKLEKIESLWNSILNKLSYNEKLSPIKNKLITQMKTFGTSVVLILSYEECINNLSDSNKNKPNHTKNISEFFTKLEKFQFAKQNFKIIDIKSIPSGNEVPESLIDLFNKTQKIQEETKQINEYLFQKAWTISMLSANSYSLSDNYKQDNQDLLEKLANINNFFDKNFDLPDNSKKLSENQILDIKDQPKPEDNVPESDVFNKKNPSDKKQNHFTRNVIIVALFGIVLIFGIKNFLNQKKSA